MKVDKKFNEIIMDLILYAGNDKDSASEILNISRERLEEFLTMEDEPISGYKEDVQEIIKEIQSTRAKESHTSRQELSGITESEGFLDRNITFFDGREIEYQLEQFREQINPEQTYNVKLKIIEGSQSGEYSFPIQGEYLMNIADWESLAYAQFREIIGAWGTSELAIDITGIG